MRANVANEATILEMVRAGFLRIRLDGTIWRHYTRTRSGRTRVVEPPRRAEFLRPDGYWRVRVGLGGADVTAASHRIVWAATNGPIPSDIEVNHRNGSRGDNRLGNLEPTTPGENLLHSYHELGRWRPTGERNHRGKLRSAQVAEIRSLHAAGDSQRALGRRFGVSHRAIRMIVTGQSWRDEYPSAP